MRALPPDDYLVVALEYVESGQEFDPEQLARLGATRDEGHARRGRNADAVAEADALTHAAPDP